MKREFSLRTILFLLASLLFCAPGHAYELYFGDIHSHTSFSDGSGLADEAYDFARNEGKVDFWSVTDHVEQIQYRVDLPEGAEPEHEYEFTLKAAKEKNVDGEFVAIAGFEWATEYAQGHINVVNASEIPEYPEAYKMKKFYRWVYKHPEALIGFNHPASSKEGLLFDNFEFVPPIAKQVFFCAVTRREDLEYYYLALDKGWWLGPTAHQDNHGKNWGLAANITGVYADELSYDAIMESFRARRFFATNDRKTKIWLTGNGKPMGSRMKADSVELDIEVLHSEGVNIISVVLVGNGGAELEKWEPGAAEFKKKVSRDADPEKQQWFAVLAEFENGRFAVSAPIILKK